MKKFALILLIVIVGGTVAILIGIVASIFLADDANAQSVGFRSLQTTFRDQYCYEQPRVYRNGRVGYRYIVRPLRPRYHRGPIRHHRSWGTFRWTIYNDQGYRYRPPQTTMSVSFDISTGQSLIHFSINRPGQVSLYLAGVVGSNRTWSWNGQYMSSGRYVVSYPGRLPPGQYLYLQLRNDREKFTHHRLIR
ncbi:hypothetical protein ACFL04_01000 [Patescibacteria group bacterium]